MPRRATADLSAATAARRFHHSIDSTRLDSTRLDSTQLDSAQLDSNRLQSNRREVCEHAERPQARARARRAGVRRVTYPPETPGDGYSLLLVCMPSSPASDEIDTPSSSSTGRSPSTTTRSAGRGPRSNSHAPSSDRASPARRGRATCSATPTASSTRTRRVLMTTDARVCVRSKSLPSGHCLNQPPSGNCRVRSLRASA